MNCFKCSSCDETNERLYSCDSCLDDSEECSNEAQKELFCDLCVVPHVKKGHDIKTAKGQVPLICETHKMLNSLYCKTCDVTFCAKCTSNHSKHEMGSSSERASEIRKELFEILTKSEKREKPLRVKKESLIEQKVRHASEQDRLKEIFSKEVEKLRTAGMNIIDSNYEIFAQKEKSTVDAVDEVVDLQQKTRNLLSVDDCQLIRDVKKLRESSDKCEQNSKSVLSDKFQCESCDISVVERALQGCAENLKKKLQSKMSPVELVSSKDIKNTDIDYQSDESEKLMVERYTFDLELNLPTRRCAFSDCKIKIDEVSADGRGKIIDGRQICSLTFDHNLQNVFFNRDMSIVILQTVEDSLIEIKREKDGHKSRMVQLEMRKGFICPYIYKNEIYQCYYNWIWNNVYFGHTGVGLKNSDEPRLLSFQVHPYVCLLAGNGDIHVFGDDPREHFRIPRKVHKMRSIDSVNFSKRNVGAILFAWSDKMKSVSLFCQRPEGMFFPTDKFSWSCPTNLIRLSKPSFPQLWMLPAVEKKSANRSESVYGVIRA
ncbi:uncharacterized protein LOC142352287 [Convolutriloba macropyga]|uniref:uncharacterized protein LOC142352287 n=1 Tax=Convolutriloba macropyga TaxID=536237 RepID=UPI003F528254